MPLSSVLKGLVVGTAVSLSLLLPQLSYAQETIGKTDPGTNLVPAPR
jgi:hypothetical protein